MTVSRLGSPPISWKHSGAIFMVGLELAWMLSLLAMMLSAYIAYASWHGGQHWCERHYRPYLRSNCFCAPRLGCAIGSSLHAAPVCLSH